MTLVKVNIPTTRPASEVRYFGANYILRPSSEGQSKGIQSTHVLLVKRFIAEI